MLRLWKTTHASILMRTSGIHTACVAGLLAAGCSALFTARAGTPFKEDSEVLNELKAPLSSKSEWQSPDLRQFGSELTAQKEPEADAQKLYELAELVDLAERTNPETKVAWEQARQAASAVGLAQSQYYPFLALQASADYVREPAPLPVSATEGGFMDVKAEEVSPA